MIISAFGIEGLLLITCWSKVILKLTNPNPHGHDNEGVTGVRDDRIGLGVLSENNDIVR